MEKTGPIADARHAFERFVAGFDTSTYGPREEHGFTYLQEWLHTWLVFGDGVEYTGRSYETYLRVALDIADAAMRGEVRWDYRGTEEENWTDGYEREPVTAIHNPDSYTRGDHYADRVNYEVSVVRWERSGTDRLTENSSYRPPEPTS